MQATHWIRSRQEESELAYWLSIVAYDRRDRSFNNRIYFLYYSPILQRLDFYYPDLFCRHRGISIAYA